jgi:hypothetical protein
MMGKGVMEGWGGFRGYQAAVFVSCARFDYQKGEGGKVVVSMMCSFSS